MLSSTVRVPVLPKNAVLVERSWAQAAALTEVRPIVLRAGAHRIPLHRPMLRTGGPYIELAFLPVAVGYGVVLDGTLPRFRLTAAELTELGHQLYTLLAKFHGYVAAVVGWDPESLVDPVDLKTDCTDELNDGTIHGLVLCESLHSQLGLGADYVEFLPGYRWIPYRGQKPGSLTAGKDR